MKFILDLMAEVKAARVRLQQEFPDANLVEAGIEFRDGERHDGRPSEEWVQFSWRVQVNNDHANDTTIEGAILKLRELHKRRAQIPDRAKRIMAILQEVPDQAFHRQDILSTVQHLLRERE